MNRFRIPIALMMAVTLWASAFIGIRLGLSDYSPGALALLRFMVASLCMGLIYFHLPTQPKLCLKDKLSLITLGIVGIGIYHTCLNYGEITVTAGVASFIIGLIPVIAVILSMLFLKERPAPGVWLGISISFLGLILMFKSETRAAEMSAGLFMIFIAAFMGAIHTVFQKEYLTRYHAIAVTTWILWGGTLSMMMFLPDLVHQLPKASFASTLTACYLGVFPAAIAYLAWSYVLEHMSVTKAALYLYAMPIISTLLGVICLNETPTQLSLLGGFISLLGAIVAHYFNTNARSLSVEVSSKVSPT